jgi:hypothetical protein
MAGGKPSGKRSRREKLPRERIQLTPRVRMLRTEDIGSVPNPLVNKKLTGNLPKGPGPGRPLGSKNGIPKKISEDLMEACIRYGEDGDGKDGLVGFFMGSIDIDRKLIFALLARIMPQRVQSSVDPQSALGQLLEAARARLQYERSRTITVQPGSVSKLT